MRCGGWRRDTALDFARRYRQDISPSVAAAVPCPRATQRNIRSIHPSTSIQSLMDRSSGDLWDYLRAIALSRAWPVVMMIFPFGINPALAVDERRVVVSCDFGVLQTHILVCPFRTPLAVVGNESLCMVDRLPKRGDSWNLLWLNFTEPVEFQQKCFIQLSVIKRAHTLTVVEGVAARPNSGEMLPSERRVDIWGIPVYSFAVWKNAARIAIEIDQS